MTQVAHGGLATTGIRRCEDDRLVRQAGGESCSSSSGSDLSGNTRLDWRSKLSMPQGTRLHTIADEVTRTPAVASSKRTTKISTDSYGESSVHPGQFALPPIPHVESTAAGEENRSHRSLLSHYSIDAGKHGFLNYQLNSKRESFDEDESDDDFSLLSGHDSLVFKYQPGQQTPPAYYELPEQICKVYEKRATAQEIAEFAVPTLSPPLLQLLPYHERKRLRFAEPPSEITPFASGKLYGGNHTEQTEAPEQSCNNKNWFGRLKDAASNFRHMGHTFSDRTEEECIRLREQSKREEMESLAKPSGRGANASSLSNAGSITSYSDEETASSSTSCEGAEEQDQDDTAARKKRFLPRGGYGRRITRERILRGTYESRIWDLERKERLSGKFLFVLVTVATIFITALGFAMFVCVRILMS
ncbi:hypothetical protein THAOC_08942 [Thalassiosira oceanica]|uniref:Uncharacterized protein n=1 Tax=Thalassiosira oceanica TaxID=159749 RepID=K0T8T5_THAOC|nr:hypothetical protein THAOC_08942 [Thalassiosira oceanica]|mmetsp:Transcript_30570/g.69048  ORF Transcript_30570/g.69048 Transcript_30570/m.69048 type:complete len:417 (+) Transcript_30570:179-1429(+)|eukprot:EJK69766.1 hypothetical protein THAOC_08942 [Thalassiosira oceanica]